MEILGAARRPVSVAEVAEGIAADRSTAYRMLMTLLEAGYVNRDPALKNYQLGYKLLSLTRNLLGSDEKSEIINAALRKIAENTGETTHYCVLDRDASVLVHRAKGTQLVTVDFQIGDRSPLHCTSIGKVLLAFQDARFVDEILARKMPKVASQTITDPDQMRSEIQKIRTQGYAFDDHEFHDDMRCLAVPVYEKGGIVQAGISLSGPSSRFTMAKLEELNVEAGKVSRELSKKLGGLS